jgi:F-type H+-transporting ATPase subunit epsilon
MATVPETKSLRCVVVTPEKAVLDEAVDFVAVPMYDGELGVLPGRAPLIGRLGYGELRILKGNQTRRYYVDGGFVQVRNNVVTLLTSKAIPAEQLTVEAAEAALRAAQIPAVTPEAQETQHKAQLRARAQLRIASKPKEIDELAALRAATSH